MTEIFFPVFFTVPCGFLPTLVTHYSGEMGATNRVLIYWKYLNKGFGNRPVSHRTSWVGMYRKRGCLVKRKLGQSVKMSAEKESAEKKSRFVLPLNMPYLLIG